MEGGVSFGGIGLNLNSKKNYNSENRLIYDIASPYTNKEACGSSDPPKLASRVEIRVS